MKKSLLPFAMLPGLLLSGCNAIGEKDASLVWVYGAVAILSLLMLAGYCALVSQRDIWFLLLFSSVLVVNAGYFALSISRNVDEALLANRISYLGSVFLPFAMMMIILNVTKIPYPKWLPFPLLGISIFVFLVAASPGYLSIYYESVTLEKVNGVSSLSKVYGPWHSLYLYYLLGYFTAMTVTIISARIKRRIQSPAYAVVLLTAVLINLGVWFIEQLVQINFEILSVTYIITELFLLGIHLVIVENEAHKTAAAEPEVPSPSPGQKPEIPHPPVAERETTTAPAAAPEQMPVNNEQAELFLAGLCELTPTERLIYEAYLAGSGTKDILQELNIKENTLKYHNKNLYSKLGVSSRKQLIELARQITIH